MFDEKQEKLREILLKYLKDISVSQKMKTGKSNRLEVSVLAKVTF